MPGDANLKHKISANQPIMKPGPQNCRSKALPRFTFAATQLVDPNLSLLAAAAAVWGQPSACKVTGAALAGYSVGWVWTPKHIRLKKHPQLRAIGQLVETALRRPTGLAKQDDPIAISVRSWHRGGVHCIELPHAPGETHEVYLQ